MFNSQMHNMFVSFKKQYPKAKKKRTIDLQDHYFDIATSIGYERGAYGALSGAFRAMEKIHVVCKSNLLKKLEYKTKISFKWLSQELGCSIKSAQRYLKKLEEIGLLTYYVLTGKDILKTHDGFFQNLEVCPNVNFVPAHDKYLFEGLGGELSTDSVETPSNETDEEPLTKDKLIPTYKRYIVPNENIERPNKEKEVANMCVQKFLDKHELEGVEAETSKNKIEETKEIKDLKKELLELFGEDVYREVLPHAEIFKHQHKNHKLKVKYGEQILIKFKNFKFIELFKKLYGVFSKLKEILSRYKAVFGEFFQQFNPPEPERVFSLHDIEALNECNVAKDIRYKFLRKFGEATYISYLQDCKLGIVEDELLIGCPHSFRASQIDSHYSSFFYETGMSLNLVADV